MIRTDQVALVDLLDRVLSTGVVIAGEVTLSIAGVDLVHVSLRALVASAGTIAGPCEEAGSIGAAEPGGEGGSIGSAGPWERSGSISAAGRWQEDGPWEESVSIVGAAEPGPA
ncbi:gas vesicle protein [Dactylosporangium sp. NPDC049140]|uniref:gas vesicle protein n=1 Tax=Dactylosporangium sp. NPDC049140 TaxID=3155647 RepID=UPI0033ECC97B